MSNQQFSSEPGKASNQVRNLSVILEKLNQELPSFKDNFSDYIEYLIEGVRLSGYLEEILDSQAAELRAQDLKIKKLEELTNWQDAKIADLESSLDINEAKHIDTLKYLNSKIEFLDGIKSSNEDSIAKMQSELSSLEKQLEDERLKYQSCNLENMNLEDDIRKHQETIEILKQEMNSVIVSVNNLSNLLNYRDLQNGYM